MAPSSSPSPQDIDRVVKACDDCRRTYAVLLLKKCNGDPDKAIQFYGRLGADLRAFSAMPKPLLQPPVRPESPWSISGDELPQQQEESPEETTTPASPDTATTDESAASDDDHEEWDFVLPRVPAPPALISGGEDGSSPLCLADLVGAIQAGGPNEEIQTYLSYYDRDGAGLAHLINEPVEGVPAFFYVIETRRHDVIRIWARYGGDVDCVAGRARVPLLAYAIAIGGSYDCDTRLPLARDLPEDGPVDKELVDIDEAAKRWATPAARKRLAGPLNAAFTVRYYLHLAHLLRGRSGAERQVARMRSASELLGIPFFLIGQIPASVTLIDWTIGYLAMPPPRPVVFVFAGPSGHGKTELAKRMGDLMSLEYLMVDCTSINQETDMFGPRRPMKGYEPGSPLNNFIVKHNGRRCVIFLDEFEKTSRAVRQALLVPFQSGEYQDRRDLSAVDCSKAIWILATNAFDATIHQFCRKHEAVLFDPERLDKVDRLTEDLSKLIRKESVGTFGAPVTSRITAWVPFLTFTPCEQAVVADKYLAEFGREVRKPIRIANDESVDRIVGDVDVIVRRGYAVCAAMAETGYVAELGARSVICEVEQAVRFPLVGHYLRSHEEIEEGQGRRPYVVDVNDEGEVEVIPVRGGGQLAG